MRESELRPEQVGRRFGRLRLVTIGVAVVVAVAPAAAYAYGAATAEPSSEVVDELVAQVAEPSATGEIRLAEDSESGVTCMGHSAGRMSGVACITADQAEPNVSTLYDAQSGDGSLVVLDSQRRLERLVATVDGQAYEFSSEDGGFSIHATGRLIPDRIDAFGVGGDTLYTSMPADDLADHGEEVNTSEGSHEG